MTKEKIKDAIAQLEEQNEWNDALFAEENSFPVMSKKTRKDYLEFLNRKYHVEVNEKDDWFQLSVKKGNEIKSLFLSSDNVSLKITDYFSDGFFEIENFSYREGELPELPENIPALAVAGETMYIENGKYILEDDNSWGLVLLQKKLENDKKERIFSFEYELSNSDDEFLEIISIEKKGKTREEIVKYFEVALNMFKSLHKYIGQENSKRKMESYEKIISDKIKELANKKTKK